MAIEQSHCRKPDCVFHPQNKKLSFLFWKKCIKCKHFVAKDNYAPSTKHD